MTSHDPPKDPEAATPENDPLVDPIVETTIEDVLRPYVGRLTPEALEEARRSLSFVLHTHPHATRLLDQIREKLAKGSGVVTTRTAESLATAKRRLGGKE
jgi:hypothetical protein